LAGPYVTAVGGTTNYAPEIAAIISGGGFSNYFERPPYQHFSVPTYLQFLGSRYLGQYKCVRFRNLVKLVPTLYFMQRYKPWHPRYRRSGHEISVHPQGQGDVYERNKCRGTRASLLPSLPPIWGGPPLTANLQVVAGVISLLNDWMLSNGRHPLGFLNPWLYASGFIGLIDITSGSNPGCKTQGFPAMPGWDPVR
jgi:tripeptidyl-peptidase I